MAAALYGHVDSEWSCTWERRKLQKGQSEGLAFASLDSPQLVRPSHISAKQQLWSIQAKHSHDRLGSEASSLGQGSGRPFL